MRAIIVCVQYMHAFDRINGKPYWSLAANSRSNREENWKNVLNGVESLRGNNKLWKSVPMIRFFHSNTSNVKWSKKEINKTHEFKNGDRVIFKVALPLYSTHFQYSFRNCDEVKKVNKSLGYYYYLFLLLTCRVVRTIEHWTWHKSYKNSNFAPRIHFNGNSLKKFFIFWTPAWAHTKPITQIKFKFVDTFIAVCFTFPFSYFHDITARDEKREGNRSFKFKIMLWLRRGDKLMVNFVKRAQWLLTLTLNINTLYVNVYRNDAYGTFSRINYYFLKREIV